MLRVLSVSTLFPSPQRPGFGRFVANQMRAAVETREVDLTMVNPIGLPPWPLSRGPHCRALRQTPESSDAAALRVLHPRFRTVPKIGGDGNPGRMASALLPLARSLHGERPFDLVDAQFFFPDGPAAMLIAEALGLPLTIKARGSDIHYWCRRPRALAQMLRAAERSARLLAVSHALARDMAALGMPEGRIAVHYTGLDRERFTPMERRAARALTSAIPELGIPAQGPLLVTPGALLAIKGQELAIAALAQLPGARLALAGAGEDEAKLRALARDGGLAERVHFLGQVSHELLPPLLSAADAVVLPSAREGLANVWIEALACGAPLVIPDVGGAREVVSDRSAGRIAARDAGAIADAVRELLAHPRSQEAVAMNAERFSWEENGRQLVEHWRAAAGR